VADWYLWDTWPVLSPLFFVFSSLFYPVAYWPIFARLFAMSYFFPIPVPFVPGIPMPLFHPNTHSPRATASSGNSSSSKHKKRVDTIEITGRASTSQEAPKTRQKFRPKQLLKWITCTDRKKAAESTKPESRSFERPAHPKDQSDRTSNEASTATSSSFRVINRPQATPQVESPFSMEDAQIIAAAFRYGLRNPNSAAILKEIGENEH